MREQVQFIQAIRGFAAFGVLIFHSLILIRLLQVEDSQSIWLKAMHVGDVGVDLFFMVSGFVMALTVDGKERIGFRSFSWLMKFLMKRFWRVMPPYWLFSLLALIALYSLAPSRAQGQSPLLSSLLLIPGEYPFLLMVGWSLVYEVYFYLIFGGLFFLFGRRGIIGSAALCLLLTTGFAVFMGKDNMGGNYSASLPIYFSVGIFLALARQRVNSIMKAMAPVALLMVAAGLVLLACFLGVQVADHANRTGWRVLDYGPIAFLLFMAFWLLSDWMTQVKWLGLLHVGEWSYSLYLSHWLVLKAVATVVPKFNQAIGYGLVFLSLMLCMAIACISWRFVEVPMMRWGRCRFDI